MIEMMDGQEFADATMKIAELALDGLHVAAEEARAQLKATPGVYCLTFQTAEGPCELLSTSPPAAFEVEFRQLVALARTLKLPGGTPGRLAHVALNRPNRDAAPTQAELLRSVSRELVAQGSCG